MPNDLWKLSALDMRKGLDEKQFSAVEVMTSVVGRMHATNPKLNAIVYDYSEQALVKAREADTALAKGDSWVCRRIEIAEHWHREHKPG